MLPTVVEMSQSTTVAELNHGFAAAIAALAAGGGRSRLRPHRAGRPAGERPAVRSPRAAPGWSRCSACARPRTRCTTSMPPPRRTSSSNPSPPSRSWPAWAWPASDRRTVRWRSRRGRSVTSTERSSTWSPRSSPTSRWTTAPATPSTPRCSPRRSTCERQPGDADRASALWRIAIDEGRRCGMTDRVRGWESAGERASAERRRLSTRGPRLAGHRRRSPCARPRQRGRALPDRADRPRRRRDPVDRAGERPRAGATAAAGDDVVLDADAKAAYRRRIEDLHSEVEDAEACADLERASRARVELDRFVEELARCTGLAGRARSFPTTPNGHGSRSARRSRAVRAITEIDHALGREIGARVVTGTTCRLPGPRLPVSPALARGTLDPRTDLRSWRPGTGQLPRS